MIEVCETYGQHQTGGHMHSTVTGGRVVVEIIHQPAKEIAPEWRNPKFGCPAHLIRTKTKAYTIPEQWRVVTRGEDGFPNWEDRRIFTSYDSAVSAAVNKAQRGAR